MDLLLTHDSNYGIGKNGRIPWGSEHNLFTGGFPPKHYPEPEDENYRKLTNGGILIMGYNTFVSLSKSKLENRVCIVITEKHHEELKDQHLEGLVVIKKIEFVMPLLIDRYLPFLLKRKVFVIGGVVIYKWFIEKNLIQVIYETIMDGDYSCDTFFNPRLLNNYRCYRRDDNRCILFKRNLDENKWLEFLFSILDSSTKRMDRTKVGTISLINPNPLRFDLSNRKFPLLTSRKGFFRGIVEELLWFLRGSTNVKELQEKGISIWDGNSSKKYLEERKLPYEEGDIGPGYGFQWRHSGAEYTGCKSDYTGKGYDQIQNILNLLKNEPTSRRIFLSAWVPQDIDKMALPPCHVSYQFNVVDSKLFCHLYQRSSDVFLASNWNVCSASLLVYILAQQSGLEPGELTVSLGDAHIYTNHIEQVEALLQREVHPEPLLYLLRQPTRIEDYNFEDFVLIGYQCGDKLSGVMNGGK